MLKYCPIDGQLGNGSKIFEANSRNHKAIKSTQFLIKRLKIILKIPLEYEKKNVKISLKALATQKPDGIVTPYFNGERFT
jgi:hypothetical protein